MFENFTFDQKFILLKIYSFIDNLFFPMSIWLLFFNNFVSTSELAFILAITYFFEVVLEVPSGVLADKVGKKTTVVLALILYGIGMLGHLYVTSFYTALLVRLLTATSGSLKSGADEALIYEYFEENGQVDKYKQKYSVMQFYGQLGTALSTITGGFIYAFSIYLPYLIVFINHLFLISIVLLLFTEQKIKRSEENVISLKLKISTFFQQNKEGLSNLLKSQFLRVMPVFFIMSFLLYIRNGLLGYSQFEMFGYNTSEQLSVLLFTSFLLSAMIFRLIHQKLNVDSINKVYILMLILLFSYIISGFNIFYWGIILVILRDVISLLFENYRSDLMNRYIDSSNRATILSFYVLIRKLIYSIFTFFIGFLVVSYNANQILMYLGTAGLLIMIVYILLTKKNIWSKQK